MKGWLIGRIINEKHTFTVSEILSLQFLALVYFFLIFNLKKTEIAFKLNHTRSKNII